MVTGLFNALFAPMAGWPAWLSLGLISAVTGVILLFAYRYTSNQAAIGRTRDEIKANMLAMKLFKDNLLVTFAAQARVAWASFKILLLSIPPLLVALIPVGALFVQMTGRYHFAPIRPRAIATVKVYLTDELAAAEREGRAALELRVPDGIELVTPDPWRQADSRVVQWQVRPHGSGIYDLAVVAGDHEITKQLPVGAPWELQAPISPLRSNYSFWEKLGFPWEEPPPAETGIRAIEIKESYKTFMPGVLDVPFLGNWIVYFLVVSMAFALIFKPVLKVRI